MVRIREKATGEGTDPRRGVTYVETFETHIRQVFDEDLNMREERIQEWRACASFPWFPSGNVSARYEARVYAKRTDPTYDQTHDILTTI